MPEPFLLRDDWLLGVLVVSSVVGGAAPWMSVLRYLRPIIWVPPRSTEKSSVLPEWQFTIWLLLNLTLVVQ